ncbi:hypothetical protein J5837_04925 [Pseudoxanthomonas helianthi]|uniref:Lipoprotein n=1 Tax=Pseudoxanthomonas helianthi TaxID=1453541 RepID=A0A940X2W5_9GAMM|nr:hypothetical protein [Pseudoxanthomonas helianthi]MBP3983764.1 hypothetical protein [Pseudoxanthomonas helianthi]
MTDIKHRALLSMIALCTALSACKPDPAVIAKRETAAQQKTRQRADVIAQMRFPRCLFLATNGAEVNIPITLTESMDYNACVVEQAKKPMTNEAFHAAIAKLYPMDKVEKSENFHCSDAGGEESCSTSGLSWDQDSSIAVRFSPKGEVTSISITWSGHSIGKKLRDLWGEPAATFDKTTRMQYQYSTDSSPTVFFIGIGDGETRVSTYF